MSNTPTAAEMDAATVVERESPYVIDEDAVRATVEMRADKTPTVTAVIGRRRNKKDPTAQGEYVLCREGSDSTTGQSFKVPCAAIRDGLIAPSLIVELQQKGGVYVAETHLAGVAEFLGVSVEDLLSLADSQESAQKSEEVPA